MYEDARYSSMRTHSSKTKKGVDATDEQRNLKKNWLPTQPSIFTWRYWRIKSRFLLFWPRSKPRADPCCPNGTSKRRFRRQKNNNSCRERRMAVTRTCAATPRPPDCCAVCVDALQKDVCRVKKSFVKKGSSRLSRQKMNATAC